MNDKPNISLVEQFMDRLHLETKRGLSSSDLLQIALGNLLELVPHTIGATVYRVETTNLRLWSFAGDETPRRTLRLADYPGHQEALRLQQVRFAGDDTALIPLVNVTGSALLVINFEQNNVLDDSQSLFLIGHYLGLLIEVRQPTSSRASTDHSSHSTVSVSSTQFLHRFTEHLKVINDEQRLVDTASKILVEATGVSHVGITKMNYDGRFATVVSEYPPEDSVGSQIDMQASIGSTLKEKQQSILIRDVDDVDALGPASHDVMQQLSIRTALIVPLLDEQHELIGTIGYDVVAEYSFEFTPEITQIAEILATHLSQNIQRIRLMELSKQQTRQLQAITQFSQSVIATHDLATILQATLDIGKELVKVDHLGIMLFHPRSNDLRLNAQYDGNLTLIDLDTPPTIPLENTIVGRAWETAQTVHVSDIQAEQTLRTALSDELRSFIAAPILELNQGRGVIVVGSNQPFAFRDNDYVAFQQLTNQLSVALQNARILAGSERQLQYKAFANQIAAKLQRQMELESLLNTAALELGQVLGARRARIRFNTQSISTHPNE